MRDKQPITVIGRDGLRGTLVDSHLPDRPEAPVKIALESGQTIEVPGSLLRQGPSGALEIALGPQDLNPANGGREGATEGVIPVLAEELHVSRRARPTGAVRVHRRIREREELVDMPLLKERLDVRRVLIEREVDGPLPVRKEGDTTIVPLVEEVLVVSKRYVLKEEVHITRTVREERHQERVRLLHHESFIERVDSDGRTMPLDVSPEPPSRSRRPRRGILHD